MVVYYQIGTVVFFVVLLALLIKYALKKSDGR